MSTLNYTFIPTTVVWVIVNPTDSDRSIKKGTVTMVQAKITESPIVEDVTYFVQFVGDVGSTPAAPVDVYATATAAADAYEILVA